MKKELLLAFLSVAINGLAANDEIVKAGSTAVPMPQYAVFTDGLHDDIVPGGWLEEILVQPGQWIVKSSGSYVLSF